MRYFELVTTAAIGQDLFMFIYFSSLQCQDEVLQILLDINLKVGGENYLFGSPPSQGIKTVQFTL